MENERRNIKSIPEDYHTVTPIMMVNNASGTIDFLKQTFDAKERYRLTDPNGDIMHSEVMIGDSVLMLADSMQRAPMPGSLYVYTENVDDTYNKALQAGGISIMPPENQFYGDRSGGVKDPGGNIWWIATHVEDLSPEEMKKREENYLKQKH